MRFRLLRSVALIVFALARVAPCHAQEQDAVSRANTATDGLWKKFKAASSIRFQSLVQSTENSVKPDSLFNTGNNLPQLPKGEFSVEAGPDFAFRAGSITISFKPRFRHKP